MKAGKCLFVVCAIVIAHVAGGAEIRNVTAKQRYPWNGKVDITYEVVGDVSEGLPVWRRPVLVVSATNRVDGAYYIATVNALTGYTGLDEGTHHLVWDLNKQGLQFRSDDVVFTVAVASVTNGSYDARPMYCVVDLSSGVNASVYPVTFFAAPPAGGFNVDEYKTTKLVMKRLESGSFKMGSSQNVTLTEPFYIGIFEVTQRQYELVTGARPSHFNNETYYATRPVENVSYDMIRGTSTGSSWPKNTSIDGESFLGKIRACTGIAFDIPTEAQWEYACRAGTTSKYNNGGNNEDDLMVLGRYKSSGYVDGSSKPDRNCATANGTAAVGSYVPNAWGLYDMHGNVWEWCLDWQGGMLVGGADPKGPSSGSYRMVRGGSWATVAQYCTSSQRINTNAAPSNKSNVFGFRLVMPTPDHDVYSGDDAYACFRESAPVAIDVIESPVVSAINISCDATWVGGDCDATVVITDNGEEVKRMSGVGEFTHTLSGGGRHLLAYTTYIDGIAQDEVYTVAVFNDWKYDVADDGVIVVETSQQLGDVVIPAEIDCCAVRGVGASVFRDCTGLTSVTIPDSVTSIGDEAFFGCSGLTSVTIPNSVTNIGSFAFSGCSGLTSVTIPNSVTSIGERAFRGCSGLTSVTIPDSVTSIGERAFAGCSGLEDITLPFVGACRGNTGSRASLFGYIFSSLSFTGSTETRQYYSSVDYERFYIPTCLKKVVVTDETELGYGAFYNCSGLASVILPNTVTSVWDRAFSGCSGLTSVTIPDSVTNIGSYAFSYCSGLTSVTIPDSVVSIGSSAFYGCSGLASVTIPASVTNIGQRLFFECANLTNAIIGCGITDVGQTMFSGCYNLESIVIPDSVTNVADYVFADCTNLQTEVQGGYKVINGWVVGYTDEAEETIPDADNLKGICSEALKGCSALKRLEFGDRARLVSIGAEALKGCTELKTLVLPPSLTRIGKEAFMGCSYLDDVIVPGGVKSVGARAFKNCTGFTYAQIEHGVESIGEEAFYGCWRITEVDVPSSVSSIGQNAFGGDSSITKVALRGDIRQMSQIFANYQSIREATVKAGSGSLVDGLFSGCSSLETVRFLGDCPALANNGANIYQNANWSLVTYVSEDSTGWDGTAGSHTLPMAWPLVGSYRRSITYADDISVPHAVAFDANGGTPKTQNVEQRSETPFVLPKEPTRAGYTFAGWWTEKNGGVKVTSGTVFIEGVYSHLYAHWIKPGQIVLEGVFSGTGKVSLGENGNIVVVLTVDVSGTVEIPDNVGAMTIDLNGHDMVGDGGLGETALPGGPAIRIVKGDGDGGATQLAIVDTSGGEKGQIVGCGESSGIEVAEDAATGVKLDVEEGVGVFNGDGSEQELKPKLIGTGKVTVPKTWKVGQKVMWKAMADKGSVFARWEGLLVDSLNLTKNERRNPSLAFVVPEGFETNMVTAVFIPIDDDGLYSLGISQTEFELKEAVSDVRVTDDSQSYVTATASGLPTGLKFDAKKMAITGTPTKSGVYWVQIKAKNASGYQWAENVRVTVPGGGTEAKEPELTRTAHHPLTVICANEGGTVSGTGVYAEGKKVSVKATPAKGYVFAGWHETANSEKGTVNGVDGADYRSASLKVTVPETRYVFALFATKEDDADSLKVAVEDVTTEKDGTIALDLGACVASLSLPKLAVSGLPSGVKYDAKTLKLTGKATKPGVYTVTVKATNASVTRATDATTATFKITVPNFECEALPGLKSETDAYGTIHAGVKFGTGLIDCTPEDGWTVKAAGLPAGLKFAAKETKDATYGVVPAWTIYGVPTAKAGAYTVTFTASKKGEKNQVATITLNVEALPDWAVGNFEGFVSLNENNGGLATMSVTAAGKVSGKIAYGGTNWTFKADSFAVASETVGYTNFAIRTVATSGKATLNLSLNMVEFLVDSLPSSTTSFAEGYFGEVYTMMYRLPWKDKNDADAAALIASYAGAYSCRVPYGADSGDVTFVLDEKGAVKGTVVLLDGDKTRKATFSSNALTGDNSLSVVIALPPDAKKGYPAVFKVVNLVNHSGEGADNLAFRDPGVVASVAELTAESGATGTVSVNPKYGQVAPGKDVTLTAKAAKGSVFHRWEITGVDTEGLDLSSSTLKIKMTDTGDVFAKAVFVTAEEDAASIALSVDALGGEITPEAIISVTNTCGVALKWSVAADALSQPKVTVSGLPAGLKFTAKDIMKKGSKTEVEIPANTIYGAPTAESKLDAKTGLRKPSVVKFTVTTAGKSKRVYPVEMTVLPLPDWAVGTFNGGGELGQVSLTVAKTGKLSGKYLSEGLTWTLAADSFDSIDESGDVYRATLIGKSGKLVMTNEIGVAGNAIGGYAESVDYITYQNNWKLEPWKTVGKPFAKAAALEYEDSASVAGVEVPGVLNLKFAASGAVTVKGSFVTGVNERTGKDILYTASGSAVLAPQSEPDETGVFNAVVFVYLPPKAGKFDGYVRCIDVRWTGDGWIKQ